MSRLDSMDSPTSDPLVNVDPLSQGRRLVVLETNEIPLGIFQWFAAKHPDSAIAALLEEGRSGESMIRDDPGERELYPSQTWATLATGVPLSKHNVYWYADPKPEGLPLYWELAAEARTVGVVGTLHSSPIGAKAKRPGLRFCVPDVFAPTAETIPDRLEPLQAFSLQMASANSRAVTSRSPLRDYARGLRSVVGARIRPATYLQLGRLAALVATRRIPAERLRTAHFILMADVFEGLMEESNPDLGVFFTNHVAAAMHRYWFAAFPDDWEDDLYDEDWIQRFGGEIEAAMHELDRVVGRLVAMCGRTGRALVLISSMGQAGGEPLRDKSPEVFVVRNAQRFLEAIGFQDSFEVRAAMVPQISASLPTAVAALVELDRLQDTHGSNSGLSFDVSGSVLTVTYELPVEGGSVMVARKAYRPEDLGGEIVAVDEHRNGMHDPLGSIIVGNSPTSRLPDAPVDVLELAPAFLEYLDVPRASYHVSPTLTL